MNIPWQDQAEWQQNLESIKDGRSTGSRDQHDLMAIAGKVRELYNSLEPLLDKLCQQSCPSCTDICCARATVWYDEKDLLFLTLAGKELPDRQIHRIKGRDCSCLGTHGCRLPRWRRPFICTWYICPAQKALHLSVGSQIRKLIEELKAERSKLV